MKLRALFVGLGGVGQRHLRNLHALVGPDLEPLAYRVRRERAVVTDQLTIAEAQDLETGFGLRVFDDLERALEQEPHICIIANPTSLHVEVALMALKRGVDVFVEKPLSANLNMVSALIQEAKRGERIAFVGYQLRFHPAVRALAAALEEGRCGRIQGACVEVAEYLPHFHPYEDYRRMYASRSDLGGGVVLTQIHEIDLIFQLFGKPETVYAMGGKVSDLQIDVEDCVTSLLGYAHPDGARWAVTLHQDYLGRPPRRKFTVHGSLGTLTLNLREGWLDFMTLDGQVERLSDNRDYPRNELFMDEMRHFLDCVQRRSRPVVDLEDGAASLAMAIAIKSSLTSGQPVPVPVPAPS